MVKWSAAALQKSKAGLTGYTNTMDTITRLLVWEIMDL